MSSSRKRRSKVDYSSEFSDLESEADTEKAVICYKRDELLTKPSDGKLGLFNSSGKSSFKKPPSKRVLDSELDRQEGKRMRYHGILAMDAYARHQKFVNDYLTYYGGKREDFRIDSQNYVTESDIITKNNKFLWDDNDDEGLITWEQRLAKKYWRKLFKEYTIADLTRFKENKIALRWRIEKEVVSGKGQFSCGNKHCKEKDGLRSWEVNFAYIESGDKKNALVKLRLCPECSYKLNYHHKKREIKRKKKKKHVRDIGQSGKDDDKNHEFKIPAHRGETSRVRDKAMAGEEDIWSKPMKVEQEMSRDEEFDKYFDDLFD